LQFFHDPAVIDEAVCNVVDWFSQHLGGRQAAASH
jgi:hypothetical protein